MKEEVLGGRGGKIANGGGVLHVLLQLLHVVLLLVEALLELEELLALALLDGVVLVGALAALESVAVVGGRVGVSGVGLCN